MSKPNLNLRFYLDKTEQQIRVEDSTDYSALGIPLNEVFLALEIRTPAGLLYINPNYNIPSDTPDITGNIHIFTHTIPLVDNMLMRGVYTVNVNGLFNNANYKYSFSQVVDFGCKKPKIKHDIDCFCAKFKSTDITDYTGSTELTYEHIINYPSETNEPDITTILLEWSDNKLANGTYVSEVRTKREWSFGNGFYVIDEIYGKQDIKVKCESLCDIKCAFNSLWEKYQQNCGVNKSKADELLVKINKATALLTLINANTKCGEVEKTNTYLSQIKDLLGDCDCGCGGDCEEEQIWVSPVCGSSGGSDSSFDYIFQSCNSLINIEVDESGQTKVITICLSEQTINTLINNQFSILIEPILTALNLSWFNGLNTDCFGNFPDNGTEEEKKQYILDLLCLLKATVLSPPVARQDFSSTPFETSVQNLVTLNDFFNSDVTVTIVTPPLNGVCTILADGKTLIYTPNNGFSGTDVVYYQITDANGQTSSSTWTITVNPQLSASCSAVTPAYNADIYSVGAFLQLAISNQSSLGTNTISAEQYIVEIRDSSNVILHSYTVTGSSNVNPTIFTTPIPIASTWDNVRIQMLLTTQSATGQPCGTVTYETPTPYSLNDISISWFDGTSIPICLGILPTDTEIVKKNKLMDAICATVNINAENGLNGYGTVSSKLKLGGQLIENTEITGNFKLEYKDIDIHSVISGNVPSPSSEKDYSFHNLPVNYFKPQGYSLITRGAVIRLDNYSLLNGRAISLKNNVSEYVVSNNETIGNGSGIGNSQDVIVIKVDSDTDVNISQNSGGEAQTVRGMHNRGIYTILNSGHPTSKAVISAFKNLEIAASGDDASAWNVFGKFIQLYIGCAKGDGSTLAPNSSLPDSYGIYQAGTNDKNEFYGEIRYHSGITNASDSRSKEVTGDFNRGLNEILKMNTVLFKRREGFGNTDFIQVGVIAQELEEIIPEAIKIDKNNGINDFRFLNTDVILFTLVNAVKELSTKCNDLESRLSKLEGNG